MATIIGVCSAKQIAILQAMGFDIERPPKSLVPTEMFDRNGDPLDADVDLRFVQIWIDCDPIDLLNQEEALEAAKAAGFDDLLP